MEAVVATMAAEPLRITVGVEVALITEAVAAVMLLRVPTPGTGNQLARIT